MIGHAVGQAVGQGGRSRRSVGQRFMTGYDRPMTDYDRPLPSLYMSDLWIQASVFSFINRRFHFLRNIAICFF